MARFAAALAALALVWGVTGCAGERPTLDSGEPSPRDAASPPLGSAEAPSDPCEPGPASGEVVSSAAVDLGGDGDGPTAGADDTLQVLRLSDGEWRLRIERAGAPAIEGALEVDPLGEGVAAAIGGADIDGDGTDELFSIVGTGGELLVVAVHVVVGCELLPVALGGEPVAFPVGADTTTAASLSCADAGALAAHAEASAGAAESDTDGDVDPPGPGPSGLVASVAGRDDQGWTLDQVAWQLVGTELEPVHATSRRVDADVVEALPALDCDDLVAAPRS